MRNTSGVYGDLLEHREILEARSTGRFRIGRVGSREGSSSRLIIPNRIQNCVMRLEVAVDEKRILDQPSRGVSELRA